MTQRNSSATLLCVLGAILLISALPSCQSTPFEPLPFEPEVCLVAKAEEDTVKPGTRMTEIELLEQYYGLDGTPTDSPPAGKPQFYSGAQLQSILEDRDFSVFSFSGSLREEATGIIDNLDEGRPLLVLLDAKSFGVFWAFLVGYGKDGDFLVVQRPDLELKALKTDRFLPWWQESGKLTILAIPSQLIGE